MLQRHWAGGKEESGGKYLFSKKCKKTGKSKFADVFVNPKYTITCENGHKFKFDKKRNVSKALRKLGYKTPSTQTSFSWSNDSSFEKGNGKVTKNGYALKRSDNGKKWFWLFPCGKKKTISQQKKRGRK